MEPPVQKQGWLLKWTNYMKGFRERWFVLERGVLSYYRTKEEMSHTCRGTLVLADAVIDCEAGNNFVICADAQRKTGQTFQLRAHSERERLEWITALELAKQQQQHMQQQKRGGGGSGGGVSSLASGSAAAGSTNPFLSAASSVPPSQIASSIGRKASHKTRLKRTTSTASVSTDSDEEYNSEEEESVESAPLSTKELQKRLAQAQQAHETLHAQLQALAGKLELLQDIPEASALPAQVVQIQHSSAALLSASSEFLNDMVTQQKKWSRALQVNEAKRKQLEESLEALAKEQRRLERNATRVQLKGTLLQEGEVEQSDGEEFFDALDEEGPVTSPIAGKAVPQKSEEEAEESSGQARPLKLVSGASPATSAPPTTKAMERKAFQFREAIPYKLDKKFSLWSVMKSCIGKDLSKIPMPVNFNEPISFTQRICEDLEYSAILDAAASCTSPQERMAHVAAFTVSPFSSGVRRTGKPFNPLLGETFELDRMETMGWRAICEQVSHHPPICGLHAESDKWIFWQEFTMDSKFRGKYLEVIPTGISHLVFKAHGDHYTWTKVPTTIHNIIVGQLWLDQHGTMVITNHTNGDTCTLKYIPYSYFTSSEARRVVGHVADKSDKIVLNVQGTWDQQIVCFPPEQEAKRKVLWNAHPPPPNSEKFYGFSRFACSLNQFSPAESICAPTDARYRADKNLMEIGQWDLANRSKHLLEEAQRFRRKQNEAKGEKVCPAWFVLKPDPCYPNRLVHQFTNEYWKARDEQSWSKHSVVNIYDVSCVAAKDPEAATLTEQTMRINCVKGPAESDS